MSAYMYGFYWLGVVIVSWEYMSLQELSEWRSASEAGAVCLSESESSSLLSELRERWSEVQSMCWCGPAAEGLAASFRLRRAKCLS